jgi:surfactin synthase thioesterase subunit
VAVTDSEWIRSYHPAPDARISLLCFPFAGGSASYYFPLSQALAPEAAVLAVQYPGRQDRRHERSVEDIAVLADHITNALRDWHGRDIVLFGHSMGATVAFEVARRLESPGATGPSPVHFIASARRAPGLPTGTLLHQRADSEIISEVRRLRGPGASPVDDDELIRAFLPAIRADYKAIETYCCPAGITIGCPITALAGVVDPLTSISQVRAWAEYTSGQFDLRIFPGGHFFLDGWDDSTVSAIKQLLAP